MPITANESYWPSLIAHIRKTKNLSQEAFAEAIYSNQATVSRWEKAQVVPSFDKQQKIEKLAEDVGLSTLAGVSILVRESPFEMLLVDRSGLVMAASASSGFQEGSSVKDQTPKSEHDNYDRFSEKLVASGFWNEGGCRFEYGYEHRGKKYRSIVVSVGVRGAIFGVVQKLNN